MQLKSVLSDNVGVPNSSEHDDHLFQLFTVAFMVSMIWDMMCNIIRFEESVAFDWYRNMLLLSTRLTADKKNDNRTVEIANMLNDTVLTPYDNH